MNYLFEIFEKSEAITPYGTIETHSPSKSVFTIDDFTDGNHFRTGPDENQSLELQLDDRLLTVVLDESGSMTWNDNNGDRYTYLKRLLNKLDKTYPGVINVNLIGFGGVPIKTTLFLTPAGTDFLNDTEENVDTLLQETFQDSVYDFAGIRVTRRTDRYPLHPADGIIVGEGIFEAVKDENLSDDQTYYYGVWTFNKNLHFSNGQFVKARPTDRLLPKGVTFAQSVPRILPGTLRDDNTQLIYNFTENTGYLIFDSSGNGNHGVIGAEVVEENFWSGDATSGAHDGTSIKKPVGVRFDGQFDIIETPLQNIDDFVPSDTQYISVNFWIFRYQNTNDEWIIGTSTSEASNNIGWAIGLTSSGYIGFCSGTLTNLTAISMVEVPEKFWTMVTVTFRTNSGNTEISSVLFDTVDVTQISTFPMPSIFNSMFIGAKLEDSSVSWTGTDYFGAINLISVHNSIRTPEYWGGVFEQESKVFNQASTTLEQNIPDNTQREVLINWSVTDDFDFSGGQVVIVRKYNKSPSHIEDGDTVLTQSAAAGTFYFLDTYDFINNGNYYYRIFTVNSIGNISDRADSRILSTYIPKSFISSESVLSPVDSLSITEGNHKLFLQWQNPNDSEWRGTRVYFGTNGFPSIVTDQKGATVITDGVLISDTTDETFAHRVFSVQDSGAATPLVNGVTHYYTIHAYNRLNQISEATYVSGTPSSQLGTVFQPADISDLHISVVNPETLSVGWENPTVKSEQIDLYFGDSVLIFINIKDEFGGVLEDLENMEIQVCTKFIVRGLKTKEEELGNGTDNPFGTGDLVSGGRISADGARFGPSMPDDCNSDQEEFETVLSYSNLGGGIVKGLLTHTNDRQILARRERYTMDVRGRYKVKNIEQPSAPNLFEYNTSSTRVVFTHPIRVSIVNKLQKTVTKRISQSGGFRGPLSPCECPVDNQQNKNDVQTFNGGYAGASQPYIARVEVQYKGESLPDGTPINVYLFKHGNENIPNPLTTKSDRTFIREGVYTTTSVLVDEIDADNNPTGRTISKSVVDIEMQHPDLADYVDIYVTLDFLGFFVDAVHEVMFLETLFLELDVSQPSPDGIDFSEQFATVWITDPDDPDNKFPVPDGTLVKWELIKLQYGKERPFYSIDQISQNLSGVYSSTVDGIARNVFFGPIGNIEPHHGKIKCGEETEDCCIGEQYAIKADVIYGSESATDGVKFFFGCPNQNAFTNKRFLINADVSQPFAGGPSQDPHWITWADGTHMLKFQIDRNPSISSLYDSECFRNCVENKVGGQFFTFPINQIVQVSAPGEILWNVTFEEDPYTGESIASTYDSVSPISTDDLTIPVIANIPITDDVTDFYVRYNIFINGANPGPQDCESSTGGGGNGGSQEILPCEWRNICRDVPTCAPVNGIKWDNVSVLTGSTTLLSQNTEITLQGGGTYENGIPPIYVGFREPLDVKIIDARVNGVRVEDLVVDGVSQHTFTVEVTFAGEPVPDGTAVEITVEGEDQSIVILSSCFNAPAGCQRGSSGVIYTRQINDMLINPEGQVRSFAYFSIDPLPNIAFNAIINTTCRYDKLGTADREITKCIELNNMINVNNPIPPTDQTAAQRAASSNELIIYDTVTDTYLSSRSGKYRRIGHFAAGVNSFTVDLMFVFGGMTGNGNSGTQNLTPTGEQFDVISQEWSDIADMPTARAYGQTIIKDDKIYLIGGIELDPLLRQYVVSRKIESFDILTGTWNETLSPMPEDYGVAFGSAEVFGDSIYVLCGTKELINSSQPGELNEKILKYSIESDSWTIVSPSNEVLYKRLSPFCFLRNNYTDPERIYIYSGSIPKDPDQVESERANIVNAQLNELRSFMLSSSYFSSLTPSEQESFISERTALINDTAYVPGFIYPSTGFKFIPNSETTVDGDIVVDVSDTIDDEWTVLPMSRDNGKAIYIPHQDIVYFIGGSNQNRSTTLNRVEIIDFSEESSYFRLTPLNRGRAMFGAVYIGDEIYLTGGLTSGHAPGYLEISLEPSEQFIEAKGTQSGGVFITLTNDSGEIINDDIRVNVKGSLRIQEVDSVLSTYIARRAADRALGGTGAGDAPDLPSSGDLDFGDLIEAQNKITDPNSDEFQFNAAKKLDEEVNIFPVLYSSNEFTISNGIGGVSLLPRSEDPFTDFAKMSQFIQTVLQNTPESEDESFTGDLTREELAALGDALATVSVPPTIINSGALRKLYSIETKATILDPVFFGQTVSEFDLDVQQQIKDKIQDLLTPDEETPDSPAPPGLFGGSVVKESECFLIQHAALQDVPDQESGPTPTDPNAPRGVGGFAGSGQCLFCQTIIPTNADIRTQLSASSSVFFNTTDWLPQLKKRLLGNNNTPDDAISELEKIDHEVPFGSSQLYNALVLSGQIMSDDDVGSVRKLIYVASDNSQNLSTITRDFAIEEINSVDGEKRTPVIYTVFSTSFPITLSAQLDRSFVGDVEKITQATGGQATTLIQSDFIDQILNIAIGSTTGGLGYGIYTRTINLNEISAITSMNLTFNLPSNTHGFMRFRTSEDGYNFTDFSERYEGTQAVDFIDVFAAAIEIEVILTTGFSEDETEEYDEIATETPKLISIDFDTSAEREDFLFLNKEDVLTNAQQVAVAFEGTIPTSSFVEIGAATSNSHDWRDFQTNNRPALQEFGKTFLLDRTESDSIVKIETLSTIDGKLYTSKSGPWDPESVVSILTPISNVDTPVLSGFRLYPREGQVYFDNKQPITKEYKISIVNNDTLRIGVRFRNRLHNEAISMEGIGYIYSTNDQKPIELSQVSPRAVNLHISPQNPTSKDTFFALYKYIDLNGDAETGTLISWFKNGKQLFEIQNKSSWSNQDLLPENKIIANDKISVHIVPSDGRDFGSTVISPTITVLPVSPEATNIRILPFRNGVINNSYDTSSSFSVEYEFNTEDEGQSGLESGTLIQWFVNGQLFKEDTFTEGETDPYVDPKVLAPSEVINGTSAHIIGNQIQVEVTPKTPLIQGSTVKSDIIIVENSTPIIRNLTISPATPGTQSTLQISWTVDDLDITDFETQTDQSEIKWMQSIDGVNFAEVSELRNSKSVVPFYLNAGNKWKCLVTPYDGLETGVQTSSNIVTITV